MLFFVYNSKYIRDVSKLSDHLPHRNSCTCITCCSHQETFEVLRNSGGIFNMDSWDFNRLQRYQNWVLLDCLWNCDFVLKGRHNRSRQNVEKSHVPSLAAIMMTHASWAYTKCQNEEGAWWMRHHDYSIMITASRSSPHVGGFFYRPVSSVIFCQRKNTINPSIHPTIPVM